MAFSPTTKKLDHTGRRFIFRSGQTPVRFFVGLALLTGAWATSWTGVSPLAHHAFFPLWLGYILIVDGLTFRRSGSSLWARGAARFALLFIASVPLWWLFEAFNARVQNWTYHVPYEYTWLAYHIEASISFSTVVPAIFVTAELFASFGLPGRFGTWRALRPGDAGWVALSVMGLGMLLLAMLKPAVFFPLVWLGVFFFIDPLVRLRSGWSIATQVERGWWGTVIRLFAAGITCGLLWEFWNWRAMPKWTYDIPYADWALLFEMPLLGYGGYLPFALEIYAVMMLLNRFVPFWPTGYLRFDQPDRVPDRSGPGDQG